MMARRRRDCMIAYWDKNKEKRLQNELVAVEKAKLIKDQPLLVLCP